MTPVSFLDRLTPRIMGVILDQLNRMTGTEGVVNDADIPVIMRNVHKLACTNKAMYRALNDPIVTQIFLKSLARKYLKSPEYLASKLDTIAARKWIWFYIHQKGYDQMYRTVHEIYQIGVNALKEAKGAGIEIDGEIKALSPDSSSCLTQTGFDLYATSTLHCIATPFGKVEIYRGICATYDENISLLEMLIRRLNATFVGLVRSCPVSPNEREANRKILVSDLKIEFFNRNFKQVEISSQELGSEKGKQVIISNDYEIKSVYHIRRVGKKVFAESTWPSRNEDLRDFVETAWKMLQRAELGQDPIAKEEIRKEIGVQIEYKGLENLSLISERAIVLVEHLAKQSPFVEASYDRSRRAKFLPLKHYFVAQSVEILNGAAEKFLKENEDWHVHALSRNQLGVGLYLPNSDKKFCDLKTLKSAYDAVLSEIGEGWEKANLKDYPNISHIKSEEIYVLLIKTNSILPGLYFLIRVFSFDLGISKCLETSSVGNNQTILWVKREKLSDVRRLLNLRIKD